MRRYLYVVDVFPMEPAAHTKRIADRLALLAKLHAVYAVLGLATVIVWWSGLWNAAFAGLGFLAARTFRRGLALCYALFLAFSWIGDFLMLAVLAAVVDCCRRGTCVDARPEDRDDYIRGCDYYTSRRGWYIWTMLLCSFACVLKPVAVWVCLRVWKVFGSAGAFYPSPSADALARAGPATVAIAAASVPAPYNTYPPPMYSRPVHVVPSAPEPFSASSSLQSGLSLQSGPALASPPLVRAGSFRPYERPAMRPASGAGTPGSAGGGSGGKGKGKGPEEERRGPGAMAKEAREPAPEDVEI
eukprot:tig00000093_g3569.t1